MTDSLDAMPPELRRLRLIVLCACYALVAFFALFGLYQAQVSVPARLFILLLQTLPLLLFLPGLHRCHLRTCLWTSLAALAYFVHGVMLAFDPVRRWFGVVEILLCCLLFFSLLLFMRRFRQYYQVPL